MAKPKPHPQSPWVPYQNLLAYFLARGSSLKEARKLARAHVALAFPGDGATPSWRKPPAEVVAAAQAWEITEPLRSLLRGRRPEARLRLDRLLLAYARGGFVPAAALREVHLDYQAMDDVPPLTEAEVATYAHVFWDFLSLDDPDAGLAYLSASLPGSEELAIWRGERPLARVRATCLVLRGLSRPDFGGAVAVRVNDVMGQLVTQIENDVAGLKEADAKALRDRAMLLAHLSLTQDRLRRSQDVDAGADDGGLGLDELLAEVARGRERRRATRPGVPWDDPAALVRTDAVRTDDGRTPDP